MAREVDPPDGATPEEVAALRRMRRISFILDDMIRIPYTSRRIGLDPLLGILPVVGDLVPFLFVFYQYAEAYNLGAPKRMFFRMLFNHGVDFVFGSIPVIGVVFDAFWKASERNVDLLRDYIDDRAAERRAAGPGVDVGIGRSPGDLSADGSGGRGEREPDDDVAGEK